MINDFFITETLFLVTLISLTRIEAARVVQDCISEEDVLKFNTVFKDGLTSHDLQTLFYSVSNLQQLNNVDKTGICKQASTAFEKSKLIVSRFVNHNFD